MNRKLLLYWFLVLTLATFGGAGLYATAPHAVPKEAFAVLLLSVLAIVAELLGFVLPNSARGSIAFIPYLASALVVPSWPTVVGVVAVKMVTEVARRGKWPLMVLNVALHVLTVSGAIWVYLALGGQPLLSAPSSSLLLATLRWSVPALIAIAFALFANSTLACTYLGITREQSIRRLWRQTILPTFALDLLAGPVVFIFAWLYSAHGAIAAAALWLPLLGLREVQTANFALQRTNEELLQLMIKSIEARDLYTSGHSRRVQRYSMIIARGLGLSEKETEMVGKAALLHDVGKIYEKYGPILRKADRLTAEEWATMQEHPIDGANLLSTMSGLREIIPAIRHHHENWDGSGYPDGLSGDRIPMAARIISFADTIDAMTSERPYRRPLTEAQVRAEIVRCRSRQFDPDIADRLLGSSVWHSLFQPDKRVATPERGLKLLSSKRTLRETA